MKGVHCQVSPTRTIRRADQGCVAQATIAESERDTQRRERPLLHVGEHAEDVGDADRRHHQRNEEDDAEPVAAADRLRAEEGEPEAEHELNADADEHVEASW